MVDLRAQGLNAAGVVHFNCPSERLVAMALERREGVLADNGALVA